MDDDVLDTRKKTSLMEMAGLDTDDDRPKRIRRATKAPETIERLSADEAEFDDAVPKHIKAAPPPVPAANDDDFLKLIEEEVPQKPGDKKKK
jgi:hypothetical protein